MNAPTTIIAKCSIEARHAHRDSRVELFADAFREGIVVIGFSAGMYCTTQVREQDAAAFAHALLNVVNNARAVRALEAEEAKKSEVQKDLHDPRVPNTSSPSVQGVAP